MILQRNENKNKNLLDLVTEVKDINLVSDNISYELFSDVIDIRKLNTSFIYNFTEENMYLNMYYSNIYNSSKNMDIITDVGKSTQNSLQITSKLKKNKRNDYIYDQNEEEYYTNYNDKTTFKKNSNKSDIIDTYTISELYNVLFKNIVKESKTNEESLLMIEDLQLVPIKDKNKIKKIIKSKKLSIYYYIRNEYFKDISPGVKDILCKKTKTEIMEDIIFGFYKYV